MIVAIRLIASNLAQRGLERTNRLQDKGQTTSSVEGDESALAHIAAWQPIVLAVLDDEGRHSIVENEHGPGVR